MAKRGRSTKGSRFYTGAMPTGSGRAPYRDQVLMHLIGKGCSDLSETEEAKVARVQRFLSAQDCAREIVEARGWNW